MTGENQCPSDSGMPLVSVVCLAYNHAKFVRQALDSILGQKTTFRYEIIVQDDASTDGTQEIIREYAVRNPGVIVPIFHEENLYSKGVGQLALACKHAQGEYIAICECDDWWLDDAKLERQVDYLSKNPECSLCFTNAVKYNQDSGKFQNNMLPAFNIEKKILKKERIELSDFDRLNFIPTASMVFRRCDYEKRPVLTKNAFQGDRFLQVYLLTCGYAHYIDEVCSVWRVGNPESVTAKWNADLELKKASVARFKEMYIELGQFFDGRYDAVFEKRIAHYDIELLYLENKQRELRNPYFLRLKRKEGLRPFLKYLLFAYKPQKVEKR